MHSSSMKPVDRSSKENSGLSPTTKKLSAIGLGLFAIVVINAFFYHQKLEDVGSISVVEQRAAARLLQLRDKATLTEAEIKETKYLEIKRKKLTKQLMRRPYVVGFNPFGDWFDDEEKKALVTWGLASGYNVNIDEFLQPEYADEINEEFVKRSLADMFYEYETAASKAELQKKPHCGMKQFMTRNSKLYPPQSDWKLYPVHKFKRGLPPAYCADGSKSHKTGEHIPMLENVAASMKYGTDFYSMMINSLSMAGKDEFKWLYNNNTVITRFTNSYDDHIQSFEGDLQKGKNTTSYAMPPIISDKVVFKYDPDMHEFSEDGQYTTPSDYFDITLCPTWYRKTHFSRPHEECTGGQFAAVVINFSKNFTDTSIGGGVTGKSDKGGGLTICDRRRRIDPASGNETETYKEYHLQPKFNTATLFWTMYHDHPLANDNWNFTYNDKEYQMGDEVLPGIRIMSMQNHYVEPVQANDYEIKRFAVQGIFKAQRKCKDLQPFLLSYMKRHANQFEREQWGKMNEMDADASEGSVEGLSQDSKLRQSQFRKDLGSLQGSMSGGWQTVQHCCAGSETGGVKISRISKPSDSTES